MKKSVLKLTGFEVSKRKHKKYTALVLNTKTNRIKRIHFGDRRYQHYRDRTPLKKFQHLDHLDRKRRIRFRKRFQKMSQREFSPAYFALKYLW